MNPSTVPALNNSFGLVMHDEMLARTPCKFKLHIRDNITKAQLVKESGKQSHI
jgi:hypothetical protein